MYALVASNDVHAGLKSYWASFVDMDFKQVRQVACCCIIGEGEYHGERDLSIGPMLVEDVFDVQPEIVWPGWFGFEKAKATSHPFASDSSRDAGCGRGAAAGGGGLAIPLA